MRLEFERNRERYAFLRWGSRAFDEPALHSAGHGHLPSDQPRIPSESRMDARGRRPHSRLSRFTARHGQPHADDRQPRYRRLGCGRTRRRHRRARRAVSMLIPEVVGCRLTGKPRAGVTSTDIVLTITQIMRRHKLIGTFVEYVRTGSRCAGAARPFDDLEHDARSSGRRWVSSPSMPKRCAFSSSPDATRNSFALVEAYAREQGLWRESSMPVPRLQQDRRHRPRRSRAFDRGASPASRARAARERAGSVRRRFSLLWKERRRFRNQGRRRDHRGDHELHEYVQPFGDDRRGSARA